MGDGLFLTILIGFYHIFSTLQYGEQGLDSGTRTLASVDAWCNLSSSLHRIWTSSVDLPSRRVVMRPQNLFYLVVEEAFPPPDIPHVHCPTLYKYSFYYRREPITPAEMMDYAVGWLPRSLQLWAEYTPRHCSYRTNEQKEVP